MEVLYENAIQSAIDKSQDSLKTNFPLQKLKKNITRLLYVIVRDYVFGCERKSIYKTCQPN